MFWTFERRKRVAIALCLAILISLPIGFISHEGSEGLLQAGDFPGFYVLPEIISRGKADYLYNSVLQHQIQVEFWPAFKDSYYQSVYPPFVAVCLYPLLFFGPYYGHMVWTFLSALSLFIASRILSNVPNVNFYFKYILLLVAGPGFYAVFGAQNSAFSILFLAIILIAPTKFHSGKLAAVKAILASALIYKPQFGVLVSIALSVNYLLQYKEEKKQTYIFFATAAFCGICIFAISAAVLGVNWISIWLQAVQQFSHQNYVANSFNQISLVGALTSISAKELSVFILLMPAVIAMIWIGLAWQQRKILLIPLLTLLSPQTLFYDLLLPLTLFMAYYKIHCDKKFNLLLLGAVIVAALTLNKRYLGSAPLVIVNMALFLYFWNIYKNKTSNV